MASENDVLAVRDLEVFYGRIQALHGISLRVPEGSIVTLLGANGAGKTTTLKTLSGLLRAARGEILFAGQPIHRQTPTRIVRRGLCQVPERRELFPEMTVLENLEMGAFVRKRNAQLAADYALVFDYFPILRQRRRQLAGTLSGGEQQMLAIGRALMARPRLLLLDEPSLGLAPFLVDEIFDIITRINREGTTVLLVEQNAEIALEVSQYGYVLETGRVVREGRAEDLLRDDHVTRIYLGTDADEREAPPLPSEAANTP